MTDMFVCKDCGPQPAEAFYYSNYRNRRHRSPRCRTCHQAHEWKRKREAAGRSAVVDAAWTWQVVRVRTATGHETVVTTTTNLTDALLQCQSVQMRGYEYIVSHP